MIDTEIALPVNQALDFGNYLNSNEKLHHVADSTVPFLNTNDIYVITSSKSVPN
jgi:hypothetical protein